MNDVPLKEYVDARFDAFDALVRTRFEAREKASAREIAVLDDRLAKMNDIREQLNVQNGDFNKQMSKYMLRDEYSARHDRVLADVRRIEDSFSGYPTNVVLDGIRTELRAISDWKANLAGRLWAIGIALALLQTLLTIGFKVFGHS